MRSVGWLILLRHSAFDHPYSVGAIVKNGPYKRDRIFAQPNGSPTLTGEDDTLETRRHHRRYRAAIL